MMDAPTIEQAQKLAAIFADLVCCDLLTLRCSCAWPDIPWRELVDNEKTKEKTV